MISQMKKVFIFTPSYNKKSLLKRLRDLGIVHPESKPLDTSPEALLCKEELSKLKVCSKEFDEISSSKVASEDSLLFTPTVNVIVDDVNELIQRRAELRLSMQDDYKSLDTLKVWGDFEPSELKNLDSSIGIKIAKASKKSLRSANFKYIVLKNINKSDLLIAIIGDCDKKSLSAFSVMKLPKESVSTIKNRIERSAAELVDIDKKLKAYSTCSDSVAKEIESKTRESEFIYVLDSMKNCFGSEDDVAYIVGYIPKDNENEFKKFALDNPDFGYMMRDCKESDNPPTLLKNGNYASMLSPLLGLLGLLPGYKERDISFFFLSFFAVFFAIIIGDAAYGLIFLITGIAIRLKNKKRTNLSALLTFLGGATTIWGAMTGTWFASKEILSAIPFLQKLIVPNLSTFPELFSLSATDAQNSVMRLCFSLGAFQLITACIMNVSAKVKEKDLSFIADIGWFFVIFSLYFLVLFLLIAGPLESAILTKHSKSVVLLILFGFLSIVIFGGQKPGQRFSEGLKNGAKNLFTTFLNIVSSFGNIMSYIRLFAVGMASVAISQSFNQIASSIMSGPMVVLALLVLVIGHTLNLVMGLLSVIVHGVRLNVMEFSNQLGLEWSGYSYHPFR